MSNAEAIIFLYFATGMLVDFSFHPQTHGWGWVSFHQKEENAWDIILSTLEVIVFLVLFLEYCISRDVMQSNADKYWFS